MLRSFASNSACCAPSNSAGVMACLGFAGTVNTDEIVLAIRSPASLRKNHQPAASTARQAANSMNFGHRRGSGSGSAPPASSARIGSSLSNGSALALRSPSRAVSWLVERPGFGLPDSAGVGDTGAIDGGTATPLRLLLPHIAQLPPAMVAA